MPGNKQTEQYPLSTDNPEQQILDCWALNAQPWTQAVRERQIPSRVQLTDQAIVNAVLHYKPSAVLDLGCGEGWLSRTLSRNGCNVIGVDAIPALIQQARASGEAQYRLCSYQQIIEGQLELQVDCIVCNFSLFGEYSSQRLLNALPALLKPNGILIIQTLHPLTACGNSPYRDGWREGSWQGFGEQFSQPAPWYFRTLASWLTLLQHSGFSLHNLQEPTLAASPLPASLILSAVRD